MKYNKREATKINRPEVFVESKSVPAPPNKDAVIAMVKYLATGECNPNRAKAISYHVDLMNKVQILDSINTNKLHKAVGRLYGSETRNGHNTLSIADNTPDNSDNAEINQNRRSSPLPRLGGPLRDIFRDAAYDLSAHSPEAEEMVRNEDPTLAARAHEVARLACTMDEQRQIDAATQLVLGFFSSRSNTPPITA